MYFPDLLADPGAQTPTFSGALSRQIYSRAGRCERLGWRGVLALSVNGEGMRPMGRKGNSMAGYSLSLNRVSNFTPST